MWNSPPVIWKSGSHQRQLDGDEGDYAITVGAKKLMDILKSLPSDQTVSLTANQSKLLPARRQSRFTLQTLPAEDFPWFRKPLTFGPAFSVPQKTLKNLISQVHFCHGGARHPLLPQRHPVRGRRQQPHLVATDGHRLALAQANLEVDIPKQEVILPRKTVLELQRLLKDDAKGGEEQMIEMRFAGNQAKFNFGVWNS